MTAPMPPIFGSARLSVAEVRDAMANSSPIMRYRWVGAVVCAVVLAFVVPRFAARGAAGWSDFMSVSLPLIVFWTVLIFAPIAKGTTYLKALGADQGEIDYRFDEDGMTIRAPGTSSTVSYRVITRFRETRLTFLVYTSPGVASVVPKRAFSATDQAAVRALLEAHVRPAGSPREGT